LKKTDEHLTELYEYYRPSMDDVITADEILTGVKTKPNKELTFDEQFQLIMDIVSEFESLYDGKYNILIESKINRLVSFVIDYMSFEIGVMTFKMLSEIIPLVDNQDKIKKNVEIKKYFDFFT